MIALVASLAAGSDSLPNAVVVSDTGLPEISRPSSPKVQWRPGLVEGQKMAGGDSSVSVEGKAATKTKTVERGDDAAEDRWKVLQAQIDARAMTKRKDSIDRTMRNGVVFTKPDSHKNVSSMIVPEKESEREYWWIPFAREQEKKRNVRRQDSIYIAERGTVLPDASFDLIGVRLLDGWYRFQLGMANVHSERLWRFVMGAGVLRRVENATIDSVRGRELTSGYELRLWEERIVRGPGPLSFYIGFGPNLRWEFAEATIDSSQLGIVANNHRTWVSGHYVNGVYVEGAYQNTYQPTHASSRSWAGSVLFGIGARLHSESGMALAGGMELGPEYKSVSLSGDSTSVSGSGSKWSLLEPTWTVGVDWFF